MSYINDWQWIDLAETGSTNDEAVSRSRQLDGRQKLVITAQSQTAGRGRRGRMWIGCEGNLFMSQAVPVELRFLGQIVLLSSLALIRTIDDIKGHAGVKTELKWPNDVLVNGKKASGMLLEKGAGDYLVIGIGVNIAAAPQIDNPVYPVTSLRAEGIISDRIIFLQKYLAEWNKWFSLWEENGIGEIRRLWLSKVRGLNSPIEINCGDTCQKGIFSGVDDNGALLLKQNGVMTKIMAGDVFYIEEEK